MNRTILCVGGPYDGKRVSASWADERIMFLDNKIYDIKQFCIDGENFAIAVPAGPNGIPLRFAILMLLQGYRGLGFSTSVDE